MDRSGIERFRVRPSPWQPREGRGRRFDRRPIRPSWRSSRTRDPRRIERLPFVSAGDPCILGVPVPATNRLPAVGCGTLPGRHARDWVAKGARPTSPRTGTFRRGTAGPKHPRAEARGDRPPAHARSAGGPLSSRRRCDRPRPQRLRVRELSSGRPRHLRSDRTSSPAPAHVPLPGARPRASDRRRAT